MKLLGLSEIFCAFFPKTSHGEDVKRKNVVFSTVPFGRKLLDEGAGWNPFPAMPFLASPKIDSLYLITPFSMRKLLPRQADSFARLAPHMEIKIVQVKLNKDFSSDSIGDFYSYFDDYFAAFPFSPEKEDYFFHFAPGNTFSHSLMFTLLINLRALPIRILELRPTHAEPRGEVYNCAIQTWVAEIAKREMDRSEPQAFLKSSIKTRNTAFNELIGDIEQAATRSSAPVLLVGPTGSGKSRLARRIFELRKKRSMVKGRFVEVNCATLRGESALSTLFGHVRGAYTGAVANRKGFIAQADKGILFLDEIGELAQDMQILLLKVIEEKTFIPFGSDYPENSEFQLICATNRDLAKDCKDGRFRLDLLSRINLWEFHLPSLRERKEDIEPNIEYELQRISSTRGIVAGFTQDAKKIFIDFATSPDALWPGNFRSLSACMERMATYAPSGQIDERIVKKEIERLRKSWAQGDPSDEFPLVTKYARNREIDLFDKIQLEGALSVCLAAESRSKAGQTLFNISRNEKSSRDDTTRLRKYLAGFGIDWTALKRS